MLDLSRVNSLVVAIRSQIALRILSILILGAWILIISPRPSFAYPGPNPCGSTATECLQNKAKEWSDAVYGTEDMNLQSYVNEVFTNLLFSIANLALPADQIPPDPKNLLDGFQNIVKKLTAGENPIPPTLASIPNPLALFYTNPPASGIDYVRSIATDFSLIPQAHAQQGFGYNQLSGFRNLWKISRNAAYTFFILAFLGSGFMVMFRVKVSAQAVATIQSILPRAVLILLLITFSYAIVGFAIDLMYALTFVLIALLTPYTVSGLGVTLGSVFVKIFGGPAVWFAVPFSTLKNVFTGLAVSWNQASFSLPFSIGSFVSFTLVILSSFLVAAELTVLAFMPAIILSFFAAPAVFGGSVLIGSILGIIAAIIMFLLTIWYTIKIVLMLAKAYIGVFISLITGPLQLLFGLQPGSKSISEWLYGLIGNLAVFPVVYLMFLLIEIVAVSLFTSSGATWIPPLLSFNPSAFTWGTGAIPAAIASIAGLPSTVLIRCILILGIYFLIPKAAEIVKAMIERKPFNYDSAIGEAINSAKSTVATTGALTIPAAYSAYKADPGDRWDAAVRTFKESAASVARQKIEKGTGLDVYPDKVRDSGKKPKP